MYNGVGHSLKDQNNNARTTTKQQRKLQLMNLFKVADKIEKNMGKQSTSKTMQEITKLINTSNQTFPSSLLMDVNLLKRSGELITKAMKRHCGTAVTQTTNSMNGNEVLGGHIAKPQLSRASKMEKFKDLLQVFFEDFNGEPHPLYELVIDPEDYMISLENMSLISDLLRDNIFVVEKGPDNYYPLLCLPSDTNQKADEETIKEICSLDIEKFEKMIDHYQIHTSMFNLNSIDDDMEETDEEKENNYEVEEWMEDDEEDEVEKKKVKGEKDCNDE